MRKTMVMLVLLLSALSRAAAAGPWLWLVDGKPTRQASEMSAVLHDAAGYGLMPDDYATGLAPAETQSIFAGHAAAELQARFDAAFTNAASRFVTHLHQGRVSAAAAGFDLPAERPALDAADAVRQLATSRDVAGRIAALEPRPQPYRLLKRALQKYRALADRTGLDRLPPLPHRSLGAGDAYEGAAQLRDLLIALGDMDPAAAAQHRSESTIDAALAVAIAKFQDRHGLQPDGVIGARTYAALTTPLSRRVRQIELTMERWRWVAALQRPDIVVNIPQFMLYTLPEPQEHGQSALEMPVIVGRSYTRTPVFVARIEQVIFNPYWDVPSSILHKELLPAIRKDPEYLGRHHFEIVRGPGDDARIVEPSAAAIDALAAGQLRLRQRPGPDNALGPLKFVIPNPYDIRLHGTPEQALFERPSRAFSHGCIRVQDPAALAEYVLKNAAGNWDAAKVEIAMCGTQTLRVTLIDPVSVVVFYATAAATESRGVLFSEDIYGHDSELERLLGLPIERGSPHSP